MTCRACGIEVPDEESIYCEVILKQDLSSKVTLCNENASSEKFVMYQCETLVKSIISIKLPNEKLYKSNQSNRMISTITNYVVEVLPTNKPLPFS